MAVYQKAGKQERKAIKLLLESTRLLLIWLGDPPFSWEIRGKHIILPVSHKLPIYCIDFPLYDTLPARVADYLRLHYGSLIMVDVGANIGDTIIASSSGLPADRFLGVEANPEFVKYLKKNTIKLPGFRLVEAFCHSGSDKQIYIQIDSKGGTASLSEANSGVSITKKTLDEILIENQEYSKFNFLKLDTDGNDFDILIGAQKSIQISLPIILMECDVFGNFNYVDDLLNAMASLARHGYLTAIAYDNFGNYFSTFDVDDPVSFLDAIAYQIISEFGYYDLLLLPQKDAEFVRIEKEFFSNYAEQKGLSAVARRALGN